MRKVKRLKKKCRECGKILLLRSKEYSRRTFCSLSCKGKWQEKNMVGFWKGKKLPLEVIEKIKKNHTRSWLGRKHTEEWKKIMSQKLSGKNNPMYGRIGKLNPFYGKKHTEEIRKSISLRRQGIATVIGDKHPNWQGGKSFEPYSHLFNGQLKFVIRKRDNFTCQICLKKEEELGCKLSAHHIDYVKSNNDINNLISLCKPCHGKTNYNKKYWQNYFSKT